MPAIQPRPSCHLACSPLATLTSDARIYVRLIIKNKVFLTTEDLCFGDQHDRIELALMGWRQVTEEDMRISCVRMPELRVSLEMAV